MTFIPEVALSLSADPSDRQDPTHKTYLPIAFNWQNGDDFAVRRLTPTECERLQGFPDGYTKIAWRKKVPDDCPDGPRYKALGNSMAVPVMSWIGPRINKVEKGNV
jgi:site-specific DNA-cytosine methylase